MKNNLLALCLLFVLSNCSNLKNDLIKWSLHGKVKTIIETQFNAIEKFGEITEGSNVSSGISSFEFNDHGFLTKICQLNTCSNYDIDEKGNLNIVDLDSDFKLISKWEYIHDSKGNIIEKNQYNERSKLIEKIKCVNDEQGNVIKENSYNAEGSLNSVMVYNYDHNGNQVNRTSLNANGTMIQKDEYEYDNDRNLIKTKVTMPSINITLLYEYKYEFDKNKNWIKQIFISEGNPKYVIKREIKYWD